MFHTRCAKTYFGPECLTNDPLLVSVRMPCTNARQGPVTDTSYETYRHGGSGGIGAQFDGRQMSSERRGVGLASSARGRIPCLGALGTPGGGHPHLHGLDYQESAQNPPRRRLSTNRVQPATQRPRTSARRCELLGTTIPVHAKMTAPLPLRRAMSAGPGDPGH